MSLQSVPRTLMELQDLQTRLAALDIIIRQVMALHSTLMLPL